jgi:branched-chain amino acid transport system ATP-binding protein
VERLFELFPALRPLLGRRGGSMSGGEQQMLCIARTLAGNPKAILLDEPSEGLAPVIVDQVAAAILEMKWAGVAVLLAEQSARFTERVADRGYRLQKGQIVSA